MVYVGGWWGLLLLLQACSALGICPARCVCRDDRASCLQASLEVVPIQFNPGVQSIDLRGNRITNVHYTLGFYTKLVSLDVSENKITSLGARNLDAQQRLVYFNASHNHISNIGKDAFKGLAEVRILDLSHNHIEAIDEGALRETVRLEHFDLSFNRITSFDDPYTLKNTPNLKSFFLHSNQILDLPSELLKHLPSPCHLEKLTLSDNLIESLGEAAFPGQCATSMRALEIASNVVREIDEAAFNPLRDLEKLDLSYNNLTVVPTHQLSKLGRLADLDLSGNMFRSVGAVAFQSLFHLRVVKLNGLPFLEEVHPRAFVDNVHLEAVVMDDNRLLKSIPHKVFHGMPHLAHVSLRNNGLKTVDASHFPLDKLRSLDVTGNPLNCNCSLLWLWTLTRLEPGGSVNDSERLIVSSRGMECATPPSMAGMALTDVPESTVKCETTWLAVAVITALVLTLFGATCIVLLLFGDKRICCKREKGPVRPSGRLQAAAAPAPVLMLLPDQHFPDELIKQPWPDPPLNHYAPDLTAPQRKQPHIVYV